MSQQRPRPPINRFETVTPRLRIWLSIVFFLVALLGVNSAYLSSVTLLEWLSRIRGAGAGRTYQNYFSLWMFMIHIGLGLALLLPFMGFSIPHLLVARTSRNRRAVRVGYGLFAVCLILLSTGILLVRVGGVELKQPAARSVVYWLHVAAPVAAVWLYCLHRLAGPRIRWKSGLSYLGFVAVTIAIGASLHAWDPRDINVPGPQEGEAYFFPALTRTASGKFIPAETLMRDDYCKKCHTDAYEGWFHSAHHFSSFNNPMYLASVRETREVSMKRDGNVKAARWCAGCHDPVPFLSGAFDNPHFDDVADLTAHAGITCTSCHAITHVNSTRGNGDYTIEDPVHYPFAFSENPWLQALSDQLIKARPALHKATFLKPHHSTSEFCSTCHKVHLPEALTGYKEFLRGQNHYDSFALSGVSGRGARSNYFGMRAIQNCAGCHMPAQPSNDFGARLLGDSGKLSIHNHLFLGANTALPFLRSDEATIAAHQNFLQDCVRVDLFGIKEGGTLSGKLHAPLRPEIPELVPGESYLLETVVRTLKIGHHFSQGTVDSNEIWVSVEVFSGNELIAQSGHVDESGSVDEHAYFIRNYVVDRDGNQISRRNPQDIYTTLYDHQIPPGAAQVIHYRLEVPAALEGPITVKIKLQYRKFDSAFMNFVVRSNREKDHRIRGMTPGQPYFNELPVTTMAEDTIIFPVSGKSQSVPEQEYPIKIDHIYQRRNDYGLALLREADGLGQSSAATAELRQAEEIFRELDEKFGYIDVRLNLARVYLTEGRLDEAAAAVQRATSVGKPLFFTEPVYAPWAVNWVSGLIHFQQNQLDEAIRCFRAVLEDQNEEMARRGFNFRRDYVVQNELGLALFERAKLERAEQRTATLNEALLHFGETLKLDTENATAHYNASLIHELLGNSSDASLHREKYRTYKVDDSARDRAVQGARLRNPVAAHASEPISIYPLHQTRPQPVADVVPDDRSVSGVTTGGTP
ncbi:multiheme c-type cytochrome [Schlesneria sp. T3-172]|uniref:multiheme c-type cytochrome n=1 Tax=Schlesneria sphaerica TaxID=3373610 RepID=UPI0037C52F63